MFAIASFTDYLDGHLARKWNMVTDFGKLFDSAADKLLCGSALMVLIYVFTAVCTDVFEPFVMGAFAICVTVFAVVIICRELFMTAFRSVAASKNVIIAADMPGKIKTVAADAWYMQRCSSCPISCFINHTAAIVLFIIGFVGLAFGTLMAVLSCVLYLRKYPQVFSETK